MARGKYCSHCERELFGVGPWHDEDCDRYRESMPENPLYDLDLDLPTISWPAVDDDDEE